MTLYTAVPIDIVMAGFDAERSAAVTMEIEVGGIVMEVEPVDARSARIVRLLRCELNDYLNNAYMPGQLVRFTPFLDKDNP